MKKAKGRVRIFRRARSTARAAAPAPWLTLGAVIASTAIAAPAPALAAPGRPSATAAHAADEPAQAAPLRFDIPEGPVETALAAFTAATQITVEAPAETIRGLTSPRLAGTFTPQEALTRLLEGTGLTARLTSPTTAIVELRIASESVQVTGRLARVDSPKYATPLSATPQTIQVISRAVMEQQGATTLSDALRNVPGITIQAGEGGGASSTSGDMFNMRGFSANNSLFVDGVRDDGLLARDTFNMEQVEVFMGPTGSDVGRGTAAGYVNMATKAPRLASGLSGSYQYGSASQQRVTLDANAALPAGEPGSWLRGTAVRLNAFWQDSGVPGRDEVVNQRHGVAPSLAFGLGTSLRIVASGQFVRQDNLPDYGVPAAAWPDPLNIATPNNRAAQPVDQSNYYGSADYDYDRVSQDAYLGRIEYDLTPTVTVRNQSRYNRTHRAAVVTSIGSGNSFNPVTEEVSVSRQANERENEIFANQTSLAARFGSGAVRHAVSAGLEFASEDQFAPSLTGAGTRAPVNIYAPDPFAPVADFGVTRTGAYTKGGTDTVSGYLFDTVSLGERWQVNGGVRVEHYETTYDSFNATTGALTSLGASDTLLSGKAGLLYQLTPRGNVYVSYGTTVTPPGTANFTLNANDNNQNNPNVDPQRSSNIEAGSKWDLADSRLSATVAVFHTRNTNVIYTVDSTAVPPIFNQDDGQTVNGVTFGVSGRPTAAWQVLASFAYLDTSLDTQNPANDGNRLTLTPAFSGSLWTTYTLPARVTVGGGLRYQGETFYNAANTLRAPGYAVVDGLVEYGIARQLTLRLNLYNLTDESYIRNISNNGGRYNPRLPRSAVFSAAVGF